MYTCDSSAGSRDYTFSYDGFAVDDADSCRNVDFDLTSQPRTGPARYGC